MELRPDVVAGKFDPLEFDPLGSYLRINEIFYSIQGEGFHAGTACIFIRLSKCNLACKFCDTEFETGKMMSVGAILARVNELCSHQGRTGLQVTLTGGEPMLQNCGPLLLQLKELGYYTTIETSGSVWNPWAKMLDFVTVSPKVRLGDVPDELRLVAKEYKWIVNAAFLTLFARDWNQCWVPGNVHNFLQPEWGANTAKYTAAAIKLIQQYPTIYRLSLQQHKLAGVP